MRQHLGLAAIAAALISLPASALETLDDVRCVCADGALGTGDYVSCVAKFTRRLESAGAIDAGERADAISAASGDDLDALAQDCPPAFGGGAGDLTGWGASVAVSTPRPDVAPTRFTAVDVDARIWNLTTCVICPDVTLELPVQPDGDICLFEARILRDDLVVRRELLECGLTDTTWTIPKGTLVQRDFTLPLHALDADPATGLLDGAFLFGVLEIEVRWAGEGPVDPFGAAGPGRRSLARVPVRTR